MCVNCSFSALRLSFITCAQMPFMPKDFFIFSLSESLNTSACVIVSTLSWDGSDGSLESAPSSASRTGVGGG